MKILLFLFFIFLNLKVYADTFESYGFDSKAGNTDVLIGIKNDEIIFEKYANNFDYNRPHVLHSLNKLFLNAFLGHLEKRKLISVNQPIPNSIGDAYTSKITLDALMRMSSGLRTISDLDTMDAIAPGILRPIEQIPNKIYDFYLLKSLPMYPPNTSYNYCFYDNNLLIQHLEDHFGRAVLLKMFSYFFEKNNFSQTSLIINPSNRYLFDNYDSFLNKIILKYNPKDMFHLPISKQSGQSSAKDILALAKLYLKKENNLFTSKWKADSFTSKPEDFVESRTKKSFFAPYTYGRYWFLNTPHIDGSRAYPKLPSDVVVIHGLKGQMLAIFPSQNAIYLRLALDKLDANFNREKHLNQFFTEFLK